MSDPVNLNLLVDDSHADFTVRFVLTQLANATNLDPSKVCRMEIAHLETGGLLSDIHRLVIHFANGEGHGQTKLSCIFKVPTVRRMDAEIGYDEETYRESVSWMYDVHNAECRFYSLVAPLLHSASLPLPFRLPKLYAYRECPSVGCINGGYLLMEDLARADVTGIELADGLNKAQAESVIRSLAHFHGLTLSMPRQLVESFPVTDLDFLDQKLHISERMMTMPDVAEQFDGQTKAIQELYARGGQYPPDQHKIFGVEPVIVHGDFWSNNMFFTKNEDGQVGDQLYALYDWQVCHTGTGITDLVRIIFVSVDPALRRAHFDDWLSLYCSELNALISRLGLPVQPRPLALVRRIAEHNCAYELCFQMFLITNLLGMPKMIGDDQKGKRAKLINRMSALFRDYSEGLLLPNEQGGASLKEQQ